MPENGDKVEQERSEALASLHAAAQEHIKAVHAAVLDHLRHGNENSGTTAVTITIEAQAPANQHATHADDIGGRQCWTATYPCGSTASGGTMTCTVTVCDEIGPVTVVQ
jgi:hypothetical protein